jgi:hypothetical protein
MNEGSCWDGAAEASARWHGYCLLFNAFQLTEVKGDEPVGQK